MQAELSFHPLANLFPLIEGDEFAALVTDIREQGLREPVTLFDGMILDGRNRYKACLEAGAECPTQVFTGTDPVAFVISANLRRRHLTESQRAMVAAKLANLEHGGDRLTGQAANLRLEPHTAPINPALYPRHPAPAPLTERGDKKVNSHGRAPANRARHPFTARSTSPYAPPSSRPTNCNARRRRLRHSPSATSSSLTLARPNRPITRRRRPIAASIPSAGSTPPPPSTRSNAGPPARAPNASA